MSLTYKTAIANAANFGGLRRMDGLWLVYHYTANDGDTDEANGAYFARNVVKASAHVFVDDDSCTHSVPYAHTAYAVGGAKWGDCAKTGGGALYGVVTNANSISIEMCDTVRDGVYGFTEATLRNAQIVGAEIMTMYDIPISRVICHFDVNGKHCPGVPGWIGADRSAWTKFKEGLLIMQGKLIWEALTAYLNTLPTSDYAREASMAAVRCGAFADGDGDLLVDNPKAPVLREQLAAVLHRRGLLGD